MSNQQQNKELFVGVFVFCAVLLFLVIAGGKENLVYFIIITTLAFVSLYLWFKKSLFAKISAIILNTSIIYKIFMPFKYRSAIRELDSRQLEHAEHSSNKITSNLCLLANDLKTPENVGSLFRLADALGIKHLYLTGSTPIPPNKKIRKTSRATENIVAFSHSDNAIEIIDFLKSQKYLILGLEITSNSVELAELTLNQQDKICLVVGTEKSGINNDILSLVDKTIHIPMLGQNSSMNVAMAAAIACYEITQQLTRNVSAESPV